MKGEAFDIRKILSISPVYTLFSKLIATNSTYEFIATRYIRPEKNAKILDLGCGTARILDLLPSCQYTGVDISPLYIAADRKKYGDRATFLCDRIGPGLLKKFSGFDLVLALGVVHHLNDREACDLFRVAKGALRPGGRLITLDGCFVKGQSPIARFLLTKDRGRFVRTKERYHALASGFFKKTTEHIHSDLLFIPYDHIIMECKMGR